MDFRLMECLIALVAERHVTRAGDRLGMSQPRLSGILARLRKVTGDPILIRTPEGMMPTELASQLALQCNEFLQRWRHLIGREVPFAPQTTERVFNIRATDLLTRGLIMPVVRKLRVLAPDIAISVTTPRYNAMWDELETSETDLLIGWIPQLPQSLLISKLMMYRVRCLMAADHPRIGDTLDLDAYLRESHVVMSYGRKYQPMIYEQYAENFFAQHDRFRKIAFYVPSALVVPDVVATTDLLALLPYPLTATDAGPSIKLMDPPFDLPDQEVAMIWHPRSQNDKAHQWLRGLIRDVVQAGVQN
jgi:DNA-binding transcriptional LysR family regulator